MKPLLFALLLLLAAGTTAYAQESLFHAPVHPPGGLLFTSYTAPLTTNFADTPRGSKVGTSGTIYLREPFFGTSYAWKDAGIQSAARNGGITRVYYADYHYVSVLGLVATVTVMVYGD